MTHRSTEGLGRTGRQQARRPFVRSVAGRLTATLATMTMAFFALAAVATAEPTVPQPTSPWTWMKSVAAAGMGALPVILVAGAIWLAITIYLYSKRKWLRMYLFGAFGFVMFVLFFAQALGWDSALEAVEARQAAMIAQWLSMHIELLGTSGLAIRNQIGWGVFDIGIECSALLELAAFAGLVTFYPGFHTPRKAGTLAVGLTATYALNIARILLIVSIIAIFGTSSVFIAHAVIGRVFFFIGIVIVYWYLMTRPTVSVVGVKLGPETEEATRG